MGMLGGEERMLGKAGEPDKEGRCQQTSMFPSPTPSLGSSQLLPKESIQIGVQKSECSQLCIRRSLPLFLRKRGDVFLAPQSPAASEADNYVTPPGPSFLDLMPRLSASCTISECE